jgi:hypothetical protein
MDASLDLLHITAEELRADIEDFEARLAGIPRNSGNEDDKIALELFTLLLEQRRDLLLGLGR